MCPYYPVGESQCWQLEWYLATVSKVPLSTPKASNQGLLQSFLHTRISSSVNMERSLPHRLRTCKGYTSLNFLGRMSFLQLQYRSHSVHSYTQYIFRNRFGSMHCSSHGFEKKFRGYTNDDVGGRGLLWPAACCVCAASRSASMASATVDLILRRRFGLVCDVAHAPLGYVAGVLRRLCDASGGGRSVACKNTQAGF